MSTDTRIKLFVPSCVVVPRVDPAPSVPPVPGTVTAESLRPAADPAVPFLRPWAKHRHDPQLLGPPYCPVVETNDVPSKSAAGAAWIDADTPPGSISAEVDAALLDQYVNRHNVAGTVKQVFKSHDDCDTIVNHVMASLVSPFSSGSGSSIVWTLSRRIAEDSGQDTKLGGKKLKVRHKNILRGDPWSIVSFASTSGSVTKNVVFDGSGEAVAQVDFGHGTHCGIHVHGLVQNNLAHTPGWSEDHAFLLHTIPWMWMCVPDFRHEAVGNMIDRSLTLPVPAVDVFGCEQHALLGWVPLALRYEDFIGRSSTSDYDC